MRVHADLAEALPERIEDALIELIDDEEVWEDEDGALGLVPGAADRDQLWRRLLRILAAPRLVRGGALRLWTRASLRRHVDLRDVDGAEFAHVLEWLLRAEDVLEGRDGGLLVIENPAVPMGLSFFRREPEETGTYD